MDEFTQSDQFANLETPDHVEPGGPIKRNTNFAGDVLKLVSGTTLSQVLTILAIPVLTRLFTPADFGVQALFVSITTILGLVACLRYELAIMLPEKDEDAANLLAVSVVLSFLIAVVTLLLVWVASGLFVSLFKSPEIGPSLWLAAPMVLFLGLFASFSYWASRKHQFGLISIRQILTTLVTAILQVGAGLLGWATSGSLIFGVVGGTAVSTAFLITKILWEDHTFFVRSIRWGVMVDVIGRYKKFPLYNTGAALLNSFSWQMPTFLLGYYFTTSIVGLYGLGNRLLRLPMSLIGGAIAQAFFPRAAESYLDGTLAPVVENALRRLVAYSLFPLLILSLVGRDLFWIVFGKNWAEAGVYTQILSLWTFFWFISSPISQLFNVLERQERYLNINILIFITRLVSLVIGGYFQNVRLALVLFSISGVITYGYMSLTIISFSGLAWHRILIIFRKYFLQFIPAGIIVGGLELLNLHPIYPVSVAVLSVGIFYVLMLRSDPQMLGPFLRRFGMIRQLGLKFSK